MSQRQRLHIGFVLEWFPPHVGGVETLFEQLTSGLARDGHQVTVITSRMRGLPRDEVSNGVRVVRVRTPNALQRYFFTVLSIAPALRALRGADVIHTTTYNAAIPGWVVALILRSPCVVTVHEVWADQWNRLRGLNRWVGFGFRLFEWMVLHLSFQAFVCDSKFTERRLRGCMGVPSDRTAVVYPAVDYDFWNPVGRHSAALRSDLGLSENAFVYLYFGRPGISKGIEYLLDAAVLVRARLPESRLVLVLARDPAKHHKQLMQRVSLNGLEDHVTVMDPVPRSELPGLLLAADCVCVPSISEGFGYSAVEANALGCVVVATTGHSVEEVIPGGAVFVPPGDSAALAEGLLKVAAGEAPPEIQAQIYDVASHLRGIEAVYRSVTLS